MRNDIDINKAEMVSVIIPAYNVGKYIQQAISSILRQTYENFEIIVVDDGSQDDTRAVVQTIGDERVFLYCHENNKGVSVARNTGISLARGQWLAFSDADDQWLPQRLEYLMVHAKALGEGYFVSDDRWICLEGRGGLRPWRTLFQNCRLSFDDSGYMDMGMAEFLAARDLGIGLGIQPIVPADIVKKHAITFTEGCSYGEDIEFYCRLIHAGLKLRLLNEALYLYRIRNDSLSWVSNRSDSLKNVYMRLLSLPSLDSTTIAFLQGRLATIEKQQEYMSFSQMLKAGRLLDAAKMAVKRPQLLLRLAKRLPSAISYYIAWKL